MNLLLTQERLNAIQSEIVRTNAQTSQLNKEIETIKTNILTFIGCSRPDFNKQIIPLADLDKAAILHAVAVTRDKLKAAELLGIGKTTLFRKLAEYKDHL